jgi:hypothetical protein
MGGRAAGAVSRILTSDNSFEADLCLSRRQDFNRAQARVAQIEAILAEGTEGFSTATRDRYAHERAQQQQIIDNYQLVKDWKNTPARKKAFFERKLSSKKRLFLWDVERARTSTRRGREVLGNLEGRLLRLLDSKSQPLPEPVVIQKIYGSVKCRKSSNRLRQLQCALNAKLRRSKSDVQVMRPRRGYLCLKGIVKPTRPRNDDNALDRAMLERDGPQKDQSATAAPRPRHAVVRCRIFLESIYPQGVEVESRKLRELCAARGFSGSTVQRALRELNATRELREYGGRWYTHIPPCQESHLTKAV